MSEQPMPQDAAQENEQAAAEQAQAAEQPMTVDVILASGSPRRKELLEREGVSFTIRVSEVDESLEPDLEANPPEAVKKLAERKAGAVVQEVLGEVARKFRKHYPDVKISVAVPDELLIVPMDAILIEQVMTNLLENAVRHGKNTTHIALSVHQEGENAVFAVQDNGGGIPPKLLPVLFSGTLRHSDTPTGDGKRNMGLGLSVCNAIVRAHGGTMHAQNKDGGAEFTFRLPMIEKEPELQ